MPSQQFWSSIPPMRPVEAMRGPSPRRRVGTGVLVIGIVLAVVGLGVWIGPILTFDQICRFAPCDPLVPAIGFRAADDGGVLVETGPRTAAQMTGVTVYGRLPAGSGGDARPPVLWQVERRGRGAPRWDGVVELGRVPQGFVVTVAAAASWRSATASVSVDNGCYEGWDVVPGGRLHSDRVAFDGGTQEERPGRFRSDDLGFTPCDADERLLARHVDPRGLAVMGGGAALVVLGAVLRRRRWW